MLDISSIKEDPLRGILKKVPILTDQLIVELLLLDKGQESAVQNHEGSDEVQYIVDGNGTIEVENDLYEVKSGHAVLVPKSVPHRIIANGGKMLVISIRTNPGMDSTKKRENTRDQETT